MKHQKKLCIIVVEDNLFYQQLVAKQLESISSTIHFFTNGEDCLAELINSKADLVVLDYSLGGELNGLDTLKSIRLLDSNMPVILFSTEPGLDTEENISSYGLFEYVEKNSLGFRKLKERIIKSEVYNSCNCNTKV